MCKCTADLQHSGEFAVPIGDKCGPAIGECIHHVAERTEGLVDQLAFFQCLALGCSLGLPLTASQVHLQVWSAITTPNITQTSTKDT